MQTVLVRRFMAGALALGVAVACRSPVEPEGTVAATFEGAAIRIANDTRHRIYYHAVEGEAVPAVLWVPCGDPNTCASVPAGRSVLVPMTEVQGVDEPVEVVHVLWWRLVPDIGRSEYRMPALHVAFARR